MRGNPHVRCEVGEKTEIISNSYLSLYLKKFSIIEKNFNELIKVFKLPVRKDYSFRIKRLGKLRAAGVFYPSFKATIFDLAHPDAFIHECFHQIDYILAENLSDDWFSETVEFRSFIDTYKQSVVKAVAQLPEEDPFRLAWNGKTKFNKSYYLQPAEIFARTGEIYISQKNLAPNSLFKEADELKKKPVYPFDDEFVSEVVKFYDSLFDKMKVEEPLVKKKETKRNNKVTVASTPSTTSVPSTPVQYEQMDLFADLF